MFAVVGEDEESRTVAAQTAVQLHAVCDRRHCVFADAEVHVSSRVVFGGEIAVAVRFGIFHVRKVRGRKVGRAADQIGNERRDFI